MCPECLTAGWIGETLSMFHASQPLFHGWSENFSAVPAFHFAALSPPHTYIHTYTHIYIYIYIIHEEINFSVKKGKGET